MRRGGWQWWIATAVLVWVTPPLTAQSVGIGANFRGSHLGEAGFRPPDTMGAVGPNHVMLLINGRYELYTKNPSVSGGDADGVPLVGHASNLDGFWTNQVGINNISNFSFDPRVTYDPIEQRWYAVAVDGSRSASSGYLLAVSETHDPTDGWTGFDFDADPTNVRWADFPMLGFDGSYVYMSANHFQISSGGSQYPLYAFPKSDLLAESPTIANQQVLLLDSSTNQVVRALDNLGPDTQAYHLWEDGNNGVEINTITEAAGVLNSNTGFINFPISTSTPLNARQPDGSNNLEVDDDRFSSRLVRINGSYWGAYTRRVGGDDVIRWFELDADTLAVKQVDTFTIAGQDLYYPSIAVNDDGDVVIGYSASGPDAGEFPSVYASVGRTSGGVTTFDTPILLKQGVASYQNLASGRNRWGDYSNTVTDPADPNIFWTFQTWASASDQWSAQVTELIVADAGEFYWAEDANGGFGDGTKWLPGAAPGVADHAIFSRTGNAFTVTLGGDVTNERASVRQGDVTWDLAGNNYTLIEVSPATPALFIAEYQGTAALTVAGGGVLDTPYAQVGSEQSGDASMTIAGNATVQVINDLTIWGTGQTNVQSGSLDVDVNVNVGSSSGTGTLSQSGGSVNVGGDMILGDMAGGDGAFNLSGSGQLMITGDMVVGSNGNGHANQTGGDGQVTGSLNLGHVDGVTGQYDLGGTATLSVTTRLRVGEAGVGIFNHNGGTVNVTEQLTLGDAASADGTYTIDSGQLNVTGVGVTAGIRVGASGTGRLIHNGGNVDVTQDVRIGSEISGDGEYELHGGQLMVGVDLSIGAASQGTFEQTSGVLSVGQHLVLGDAAGAEGDFDLSGDGQVDITAEIQVGREGAGAFTQNSGGVAAAGIVLAVDATGDGTYHLQGGTLDLQGNNITIGAGTGAFNFTGGTLRDAGTVGFDLTQSGSASLAPGGSAGATTIQGDYTITSPTAVLEIELGGLTPGTQHDQLNVTGTANLAGVLDVALIDAFAPNFGDTFTILTAAGVVGDFDTQNLPVLAGVLDWSVQVGPTAVLLEIIANILLGDANNDGQVNGADLVAVQANFGGIGPADGLLLGDANDDGQVTGADLISVQQNFGNVLAPTGNASTPEPTTAIMLSLIAALARRPRLRQRCLD